MASEAAAPAGAESRDLREAIESLEAQLKATPRAVRPYEHATICYRLGMAYAESPVGSRLENLRKALACFDVAAGIFDPRYDPVEHARVLNAAGATHRAIGDRRKAAELFEKAGELFEKAGELSEGRDRDAERAAALNNLGLARTELGQPAEAVAAFDAAAELFDVSTPDGRRGRVATLHNRGQAHAALGTVEGLEAALADYDEAQGDLDPEEAPYHHGLMQHSVGVACTSLAALRSDERRRLLEEAVSAFGESLTVFTRAGFPFQHALAKHNLGLAHAALADGADPEVSLRHVRLALASFEDAVGLLDTRVHGDAWRQAFASLSRVEQELESQFPGVTRAGHFAALLAGSDDDDDMGELLRERLGTLLALPDPRRRSALAELAQAVALLGADAPRKILEVELSFLVELPVELQEPGLRGIYEGHGAVEDDVIRDEANVALDGAIGEALQGPQRIFVRDFLYSLGWERP